MKALAFDFNGTMYMDTDKHRQAWNLFFQKYIGRPLEEEEFLHYACGPRRREHHAPFFPAGDGRGADHGPCRGKGRDIPPSLP